jgi:hypothetical protein
MITTTRSMVLLSAVVATAVVAVFEIGRAENASAATQVAQRFPSSTEMFTPVPITTYVAQKFITAQKVTAAPEARRSMPKFCASTPNGWPYVSDKCLVAGSTQVPRLIGS